MNATLLIELLTEELPPKALSKLGASLAQTLTDDLKKQQFIAADAQAIVYASPRRLALQLPAVRAIQPEQQISRKGPAVTAGMKDGQATPALSGFARSCGVEISQLTIGNDGKQDVYLYESIKPGQPLASILADSVSQALKKLPVPKLMRWGASDVQFVRPLHGLIMLHGDQVIPGEVFGLHSRQQTLGHRFLSNGLLTIATADSYPRTLHEQGKVIASFEARRELIRYKLNEAATRLGATLAADEALFDEVTGLVEWPVVLEASFDPAFLQVPQECLILTMQQNQKYFPLLDANGKLMHRFLLVSNLETADPSYIIGGNERVLRARLSDAQFFFEQDQKVRLDSRLPRLAQVVYHNQLGSQLERVERLQSIAGNIAQQLGADIALASRAAYLAKADLVSGMVGEFPELQGIMGMYYAQRDGEHPEVAAAIAGHYHPRFAGDSLPASPIATAVALADKLETIVGIWGIGLIPTGDKDPFALRRAALGVLRMALEHDLDLKALLETVAATFPAGKLAADTSAQVFAFMLERLKHLLANDYQSDEIDAVLALTPSRLHQLHTILSAVANFKTLPEATTLAAANKRVKNILKKTEGKLSEVQTALLQEVAEKTLYQAVEQLAPQVASQCSAHHFSAALSLLSQLKVPVDAFFDEVMVMADDPAIRANRLALLARLAELFNQVADISLLAE
ncbi:glycine--tRNA ligase subunit beta [Neisseriaceae bacterium TC5R-5]|nr:glycine--tRNA ligase subunit beta [Neisseriaceae bacterium TC5R-5]